MEAVRVIFNLLLFLIFLQSSSKAIAYLYDVFKCECDYFLPAYIIDVRQCGHSASCYWALQFYLTKMGEANIKVDGLPSVTELQTKWTTIMNNYESPIKYPFGVCLILVNEFSFETFLYSLLSFPHRTKASAQKI